MRKIRLDIEKLNVETFATGDAEPLSGTVRGHWSQLGTCDAVVATCQLNGTCRLTCGSKCGSTTCE